MHSASVNEQRERERERVGATREESRGQTGEGAGGDAIPGILLLADAYQRTVKCREEASPHSKTPCAHIGEVLYGENEDQTLSAWFLRESPD